MKKVLIVLMMFVWSQISFADSTSERKIRKSDLLTYSLVKAGVKSLRFKMKVQGLKENLNKRKNLGVIKDVFFEVSWQYPQKLEVKVIGLPKGFREIKEQLKMAVYSRFPLLFPAEKMKMVSGYLLKFDSQKNIITATDRTGKNALNIIKIQILENGMIKYVEGMGASGSHKTSYSARIQPWSKKKFVYNIVESLIKGRNHNTTVKHNLKFSSVRGYGVPLSITTTTKVTDLKKNEEKVVSKIETVFYDYVINGAKQ